MESWKRKEHCCGCCRVAFCWVESGCSLESEAVRRRIALAIILYRGGRCGITRMFDSADNCEGELPKEKKRPTGMQLAEGGGLEDKVYFF